jgi:hypothetical protein
VVLIVQGSGHQELDPASWSTEGNLKLKQHELILEKSKQSIWKGDAEGKVKELKTIEF